MTALNNPADITALTTLTDDVGFLNGFPNDDAYQVNIADHTITSVDGTRTITISPTVSEYHICWRGRRVKITAPLSIQVPNIEGPHAILYDGDTGALRSFAFITIPPPLRKNALAFYKHDVYITVAYWNVTDQRFEYVGHQELPCGASYINTFFTATVLGTVYGEGMALGDFVIGDGSANTHAQFSVAAGSSNMSGTLITHDAVLSTAGIPVLYQYGNFLGAGIGLIKITSQAGYSCLNAPSGRVYYNKYDTGTTTWSAQEATNNYHVLYHVFSSGSVESPHYFAVMGWGQYLTTAAAEAAAETEIQELRPSLIDLRNFARVGTIILKTSDVYGNAVKAKIIQTAGGENYVDYRGTIQQGA